MSSERRPFARRNQHRIERCVCGSDPYQVVSDCIPPVVLLEFLEARWLRKNNPFC